MELAGKTAVVTGGAGGIGRAMGERFAREGMKVILADVQPGPLADSVFSLRDEGFDVVGVPVDVTDYDSVVRLRQAAIHEFGKVHVLCNNAGIGAGAEGRMWEHELNDWKWAMAVNVWGVVHGINAFVPSMIEHGEEGCVINTSSGNGGVAPLASTPQYAATKAAVVTITECLYGQLAEVGSAITAAVLFPGPHMLRTGLFESWRTRPDEFAKERPRVTPYTTVEALEEQMRAAGVEPKYTAVEDVAAQVVDALHAGQFWIQPASDGTDAKIRARAESMLTRTNPTYLRAVPG